MMTQYQAEAVLRRLEGIERLLERLVELERYRPAPPSVVRLSADDLHTLSKSR